MRRTDVASLRDVLRDCPDLADRVLWGADTSVPLADIIGGTALGGHRPELHGRSVLLSTDEQLATALALIELDGVARRLVICPPDVPREHLSTVIADAEINAVVCDRGGETNGVGFRVTAGPIRACEPVTRAPVETEWVLLTSGTCGAPKAVVHRLSGLTGAIAGTDSGSAHSVWGTFYDIRRYGGLQIFLRAIFGRASLVLSSRKETLDNHLSRLGRIGVTHISGTPSHWRRVLMSPCAKAISPRYIRLSGEIADQAVLDRLRSVYPQAAIGHAYASTEAGVGFAVDDGLEGFPAGIIEAHNGSVEMKVEDGSLRIRSPRTASRYLGTDHVIPHDADGFVDTGDMVERRGDRYYFVGRRGGIINVGGLKVHPEEVEAVINRHPDVRMSLVRSKRSPIVGFIVVADVVLSGFRETTENERQMKLRREILDICRGELAQHKVPADVRFVPELGVSASGKIFRSHA